MKSRSPRPRRAIIVICVLVCLLVASAMVTATTQSALRARREVNVRHQMRQTELLLDAGVLRAARQFKASSDYQGETWSLAKAFVNYPTAVVEIRVRDASSEGLREVEVTATLDVAAARSGLAAHSQTRRTHTFSIQTNSSSDSE